MSKIIFFGRGIHHLPFNFFKLLYAVIIYSTLISLFSCNGAREERINNIVSNYTISDLRYFSEVFSSHNDKNIKFARWRKDIKYFVVGNPKSSDVDLIDSVLATFNGLSLPVKIIKSDSLNDSNLKINFFEFSDSGKPMNRQGYTSLEVIGSSIISAEMFLSNRVSKSLIVHEMLHAFGLIGHCLFNTDDVLYLSAGNNILSSSNINSLKILYSKYLPRGYSVGDFENDFGYLLNNNQRKERLFKYASNSNLSIESLEEIYNYGLIPNELLKHDEWVALPTFDKTSKSQLLRYANKFHILYNDRLPPGLIDSLSNIISELNKVTPYLQINLLHESDVWNSGILLLFVNDSLFQRRSIGVRNLIACYNQKDVIVEHRSAITFFYADLPHNMGEILSIAIYKRLCLQDPDYLIEPFFYRDGKLTIKPHYAEILKFYYDPEVPLNLRDDELLELINSMKYTDTIQTTSAKRH
jgi:hypothetical protein